MRKKKKISQTVRITDKYNSLNGLVVCRSHNEKNNPQAIPFKLPKENITPNPKMIRSEPTDKYVVNENSDRAPSAPRNLTVKPHPLNSTIYLQWQGPIDAGSDDITGYVITRADPQGAIQIVIVSNTGSDKLSYEDTEGLLSGSYTYTVKAINAFGTGAESDLGYYPVKETPDGLGTSVFYLVESQTDLVLQTGDGENILAGA